MKETLRYCWKQCCITSQSFVDGKWVCSECGLKIDPMYAWQTKIPDKPKSE